jgi:uncharacterized membrane protein SirB2
MLEALAHDPLKALHVGCALLSITLFVVRGTWRFAESPRLQQRWVRIAPHLIDTVFLGSGIALAVRLHQYPFADAWLTAKVLGLVAYIILGSLALKGRTPAVRTAAFVAALLTFAYIVGVARVRNPGSWAVFLGG